MSPDFSAWPDLPLDAWSDTYATLHLWTQVVGKVRLAQTPWVNHSWHVILYVTARGLDDIADSSWHADIRDRVRLPRPSADDRLERRPRPTRAAGAAVCRHVLCAADGGAGGARPAGAHPHQTERDRRRHPLRSGRDAPFVRSRVCRSLLAGSGPGRPGPEDLSIALQGQVQPGAFFLGRRDMAVTRFSGRPAPEHPGGIPNLPDWVAREAYSHEVSSCGFWAGGGPIAYPVFYSYAYPEPAGSRTRACGRTKRSTVRSFESSSCPTIASGSPTLRTTRCWSSCNRRTRRRPRWRTGIASRSSARPNLKGELGIANLQEFASHCRPVGFTTLTLPRAHDQIGDRPADQRRRPEDREGGIGDRSGRHARRPRSDAADVARRRNSSSRRLCSPCAIAHRWFDANSGFSRKDSRRSSGFSARSRQS